MALQNGVRAVERVLYGEVRVFGVCGRSEPIQVGAHRIHVLHLRSILLVSSESTDDALNLILHLSLSVPELLLRINSSGLGLLNRLVVVARVVFVMAEPRQMTVGESSVVLQGSSVLGGSQPAVSLRHLIKVVAP